MSMGKRRHRKPVFERFEQRELLSIQTVAPPPAAVVSISPPGQGLTLTLTTDRRVYRAGQPVVMTLTETNTSTSDIHIASGPASAGFVAMRAGRRVWTSNPGIQPMFLVSQTLRPGQSISWSSTWIWGGRSNTGRGWPASGRFTIASQVPHVPPVTILIRRS